MKKKILAMLLGIALVIQPCSTVIATDVQQNSETATIDENEENVEIPNEIETNEKNQENSNIALEEEVTNEEKSAESGVKDTEAPVIHQDTLMIDKTEVTVGDVIKISVKVTDNSELKKVILDFENLDNNNKISWSNMTYNAATERYEYSLSIPETMVAGHWRISSVQAYDMSDNKHIITHYTSEEGGVWDFYVKNDNVDSEAPIIDASSLKINKRIFAAGDEILISAKISDNVKVGIVRIEVCKDSEIFGDSYAMTYNDNTGLFECTIKTDESWIGNKYVQSIIAYDTINNYSYNSWNAYDDNAFFTVTKDGEANYDCEVVDLKCVSGETTNYSYSYSKSETVFMRIFDPSIVGYVDQSFSITNSGYEVGGVFTPYKEGETTVEVFDKRTGKILKAYKIEVSPKEHFVCNEKEVKGTFLTNKKQNYSVLCDGQKIDADVTLIRSSEIGMGSSVRGQYEYEYKFALNESGDKKVSIIGDSDNKEITLNIHVNSHQYSEPIFTWNNDNTCTVTYSCSNCNKTETDQTCEIVSSTIDATCTTAGKTVYTASIEVNGNVYSDVHEVDIPALGHHYGEPEFQWSEDRTCVVKFKCSICGNVQNLECSVTSETKDPVCTEKGEITYTATCMFEDKEYTDTKTVDIPSLGHQAGYWTIVKEATCMEEGLKVKKCARCESILEEKILSKVEHVMSDWQETIAPTCTSEGAEERVCTICGDKETIDKLSVVGKPSTNTNDKDESPKDGAPKSGDTSSIMIYIFGIIVASLLICFEFVVKKKKR